MTIEEMGQVMDVLNIAYPQYYKNISEDRKFGAACLWAEAFADEPAKLVVAAVKAFILTDDNGFPPSIGIINNRLLKVKIGYEKTEAEAWNEVKKALKNSCYNSAEEFKKLEPAIQRIVGAPSQLKEWATYDIDKLDTVIGSNFQRSYKASSKNYREYLMLPQPIRDLISSVSSGKSLESAYEVQPQQSQQKALPVSVEAIIEGVKAEIGRPLENPNLTKKRLSHEEFERKRAQLLASIGSQDDPLSLKIQATLDQVTGGIDEQKGN